MIATKQNVKDSSEKSLSEPMQSSEPLLSTDKKIGSEKLKTENPNLQQKETSSVAIKKIKETSQFNNDDNENVDDSIGVTQHDHGMVTNVPNIVVVEVNTLYSGLIFLLTKRFLSNFQWDIIFNRIFYRIDLSKDCYF